MYLCCRSTFGRYQTQVIDGVRASGHATSLEFYVRSASQHVKSVVFQCMSVLMCVVSVVCYHMCCPKHVTNRDFRFMSVLGCVEHVAFEGMCASGCQTCVL